MAQPPGSSSVGARPRAGAAVRGWGPLLALLLALAVTAGECRRSVDEEPPRARQLFLSVSGLMAIAADQGFYELWLGSPAQSPPPGTAAWDVPQTYVSAVPFLVDTLGIVTRLNGTPIASVPLPSDWDANALARAILTFQPPGDAAVAHGPGFRLAAGAFTAPGFIVTGQLSAQDPEVTPLDLQTLSGEVTLATPTTASTDDEAFGAWFYRGTLDAPEASLYLGPAAALPDSHVFESWLRESSVSGRALALASMGRFRNATGLDSDGAGPNAGPEPPLPLPGQDFLGMLPAGLPELSNPEIMITLEPEPDPAPGQPSSLRVLRIELPAGALSHVPLALANSAATGRLPQATVTVQR